MMIGGIEIGERTQCKSYRAPEYLFKTKNEWSCQTVLTSSKNHYEFWLVIMHVITWILDYSYVKLVIDRRIDCHLTWALT